MILLIILPDTISKILWDLIIPYFKNLFYHLEDDYIGSASNKLENYSIKTLINQLKKYKMLF